MGFWGGCEDPDKCCLCFPVGCGIKTIGVFHILGTIVFCGFAALLVEVDVTAGAIMFTALLPMIAAAYFYIRFLANSENQVHRQHLKYAIWLSFFTVIISAIAKFVAINSVGDINTKAVKVLNAANPG